MTSFWGVNGKSQKIVSSSSLLIEIKIMFLSPQDTSEALKQYNVTASS